MQTRGMLKITRRGLGLDELDPNEMLLHNKDTCNMMYKSLGLQLDKTSNFILLWTLRT